MNGIGPAQTAEALYKPIYEALNQGRQMNLQLVQEEKKRKEQELSQNFNRDLQLFNTIATIDPDVAIDFGEKAFGELAPIDFDKIRQNKDIFISDLSDLQNSLSDPNVSPEDKQKKIISITLKHKKAASDKTYQSLIKEYESSIKTKDPEQIIKVESNLRSEVQNLSKDFFKVRDAYGRIQASTSNPSPAGDLSLIFNFMKMLDPNSVVRESEFATAENSGSVPERIWKQYNKILSGERLSPNMRDDFLNQSKRLYNKAHFQNKKITKQYSDLVKRYGGDPQNVILDLNLVEDIVKDEEKQTYQANSVFKILSIE